MFIFAMAANYKADTPHSPRALSLRYTCSRSRHSGEEREKKGREDSGNRAARNARNDEKFAVCESAYFYPSRTSPPSPFFFSVPLYIFFSSVSSLSLSCRRDGERWNSKPRCCTTLFLPFHFFFSGKSCP